MLNLLPLEEKKRVRKEYRFRLVLVIALFFLALGAIAVVTLLPAYILEKAQLAEWSSQTEVGSSSTVSQAITPSESKVKELIPYLSTRITAMNGTPKVSEIINRILNKKSSTLIITTIRWNPEGVGIVGIAKTRNDLIAFYKALKEDIFFKEVIFPIDDIAKSTNNDFTIELKFK